MNVSHFELIFKPQSPVPPADTVLQGYFLSISNLEDVELSFRLDFVHLLDRRSDADAVGQHAGDRRHRGRQQRFWL